MTRLSPFAENIVATERRIHQDTDAPGRESDNADYVAYAIDSTLAHAIHDPLICARFWAKVNRAGPIHPALHTACWLWTASCTGHGNKTHPRHSRHGQFTFRLQEPKQHHVYAHRFAWMLEHGPIPPEVLICHHCDVAPCCRHHHLFCGSQDDNLKDAARKGRLTVPRHKKLTLAERLEIMHAPHDPQTGGALARQYGVSKVTIHHARQGRFIGSGRHFAKEHTS